MSKRIHIVYTPNLNLKANRKRKLFRNTLFLCITLLGLVGLKALVSESTLIAGVFHGITSEHSTKHIGYNYYNRQISSPNSISAFKKQVLYIDKINTFDSTFHKVKPNETVYSICKAHDISIPTFLKWNDLDSSFRIKVGDNLLVKKVEVKTKKVTALYKLGNFGIDLSSRNGIMDWKIIKGLKDSLQLGFVVLKSSQGASDQDVHFAKNKNASDSLGLKLGLYHVFEPQENPTLQANNYLNTYEVASNKLIPIVAITCHEVAFCWPKDSIITFTKKLHTFISEVQSRVNTPVIINCSVELYNRLNKEIKQTNLFWLNYYSQETTHFLRMPQLPHSNIVMWRFTDQGSITGRNSPTGLSFSPNYNDSILSYQSNSGF